MITTNIVPICPLSANGQPCGPSTNNGCTQALCLNNLCVNTSSGACAGVSAPACSIPICSGSTCSFAPDATLVNTTCIPGPNQTAMPCNHFVCSAYGQCVQLPDNSQSNMPCVPPDSTVSNSTNECSHYICIGNGICSLQPNPTSQNTTCTPTNGNNNAPSSQCQRFACGTDGSCNIDSQSVGIGQPCTPTGMPNPCSSYTCEPSGQGNVCTATANPAMLGQPCPLSNISACSKAVCAPDGTCQATADSTRVDTLCQPGPGIEILPCIYYTCGSDGLCDHFHINNTMIDNHVRCWPSGMYMNASTNCSIWLCNNTGSCIFDHHDNVTAICLPPGAGGKIGMIIGIVAGIVGAIVLAAAVIAIIWLLTAGPLAAAAGGAGAPPACGAVDVNPLYTDKITHSPAYHAAP